jgi:hypothetical protein
MKRVIFIAVCAALASGGCQHEVQKPVNVVSSPYKSGVKHSEPVFFNGKHYKVSFTYSAARNNYDVTVAGRGGRQLGGQPGDQKIVEQIGSSAVRHFACASGQKAQILPGSQAHAKGSWNMQARCA